MSGWLDGKAALVTGAGRGIGRAIALDLAAEGARLALVARSVPELDETARQITAQGGTAVAIPADLADPDGVRQAVSHAQQALGRIDVLVNNAATGMPVGPSVSLAPAEWARTVAINLTAPALLAFALLPPMLEAGWGRVVNVSSGMGSNPTVMTGGNAYVTTKAGLEGHTLNLAAELAATGVTVNIFDPGAVDTTMMAGLRDQPYGTFPTHLHDWANEIYETGGLLTPASSAQVLLSYLGSTENGHLWKAENG